MNQFKHIIDKKKFGERIKWLIKLRWIAALSLFIVITGAHYLLNIELKVVPLYIGNCILVFYNIIFSFYKKRLDYQENYPGWLKKANFLANIQSSLDLTLLTFLIHYSGGIENPFIFFYIFHMVIASIILSNRAAYLQATFAIVIFGFVMGGESVKLLHHYNLPVFALEESSSNVSFNYFLVRFPAFFSTLYITVYMSTNVINVLRERERELKRANEQLEEKDRIKSQYVMNVTHDLKSSLSTIQTCLRVVLAGFTGSISAKSRAMIDRAEQRSQSLYHFVEDLLDLSKIRATRTIAKEEVTVSKAINTVVEQLKPQIKKAVLGLVVENDSGDAAVFGNQKLIEDMFLNVIVNAIKYTPSGGTIMIKSRRLEGSNDVQVSITDTGIGISENDLPHIFEDFYRAENAEELKEDGTGLGLSIVKQIVEVHGGKITVESQMGKTSSFVFTLPGCN